MSKSQREMDEESGYTASDQQSPIVRRYRGKKGKFIIGPYQAVGAVGSGKAYRRSPTSRSRDDSSIDESNLPQII